MKKFQKIMASALCVIIALFSCGCAQIMDVLNSLTSTLGSIGNGSVTATPEIFEGNYKRVSLVKYQEIVLKAREGVEEEETILEAFLKLNNGVMCSHSERISGLGYAIETCKILYEGNRDEGYKISEAAAEQDINVAGYGEKHMGTINGYFDGQTWYVKDKIDGNDEKFKISGFYSAFEQTKGSIESLSGNVMQVIDIFGVADRSIEELLSLDGEVESDEEGVFIDETDVNYIKVKVTRFNNDNPMGEFYKYEGILVFNKQYQLVALGGNMFANANINGNVHAGVESEYLVSWGGTIQKPNDLHTYPAAE